MATPTNLPPSFTVGQVLTAAQQNDLRGGFRILQLKASANDTTLRSSTTTTFTDSGLTVSITPQETTNKVLAIYFVSGYVGGATTGLGLRLVRGSTTLVDDLDNGYGSASGNAFNSTFFWLDSPSTTSATTYKIQFNRNQGASTVYMNASASPTSRLIVMEVSA